MKFPMRIPFNLGKVKNSDEWDDAATSKYLDLVKVINEYAGNKHSEVDLTPLNTTVYVTPEYNITSIESLITPAEVTSDIQFSEGLQKRLYYLIVDSNGSTITLDSSTHTLLSNNHGSYNRTLYILRKLDESTVIVYKELKDMYIPDPSEFDTLDFVDLDLTSG